jgi:transglutaminase-like putative cysteine protease
VSGHLFRRDGAHFQQAGHAWAEAWVEDLGWVAFDPLNGISTDDAYVRIACGLDYRDAAPISGARAGGGGEQLAVEVRVSEAAVQGQSQQ